VSTSERGRRIQNKKQGYLQHMNNDGENKIVIITKNDNLGHSNSNSNNNNNNNNNNEKKKNNNKIG
jgi:hypothetical protein